MLIKDVIKTDNNNLNFVRLWLAFSVIIGHIPVFIADTPPISILSTIFPFTYCGTIAVVTFFFFSGLLVTNSLFTHGNIKLYLVSRFLRIYPTLLFFLVVSSLIGINFSQANWHDYLKNALDYIIHNDMLFHFQYFIRSVVFYREGFPQPEYGQAVNTPLWVIIFELRMYIFLILLFLIYKIKKVGKILVTLILIININFPIFFQIMFLNTNADLVDYYVQAFAFGSLLALYKDKIYLDWKMPLLFLIIYFVFKTQEFSHFFAFMACSTFCLLIATTKLIKKIPTKIDISYGVYVFGWFTQQVVQFYAYRYLNFYTFGLVCIVISALLGIIAYYLIEKPCLKLKKYAIAKWS